MLSAAARVIRAEAIAPNARVEIRRASRVDLEHAMKPLRGVERRKNVRAEGSCVGMVPNTRYPKI